MAEWLMTDIQNKNMLNKLAGIKTLTIVQLHLWLYTTATVRSALQLTNIVLQSYVHYYLHITMSLQYSLYNSFQNIIFPFLTNACSRSIHDCFLLLFGHSTRPLNTEVIQTVLYLMGSKLCSCDLLGLDQQLFTRKLLVAIDKAAEDLCAQAWLELLSCDCVMSSSSFTPAIQSGSISAAPQKPITGINNSCVSS